MKKSIFFTLLTVAGLVTGVRAQEKTVKLSPTSKLVYNVDPGNHTKTGVYAIQNLKNDGLWLQGNYKNDARIGTWYFFDASNKLSMRYNYDQKKLAYVDTTGLSAVSVKVLATDPDAVKNASAPLPLCSLDYLVSILAGQLDANSGKVTAEITAHVGVDGKATYSVSYVKGSKKTDSHSINYDASKFWIDWIPSMYKNQPVESEFTIYATIDGVDAAPSSAERRIRWN